MILPRLDLCLLLLLIFAVGVATASEQRNQGTLIIEISGLQPTAGGQLRVALFAGEEGWPKLQQAFRLQQRAVSAERLRIEFVELPLRDDYAIEVHHDENANGQFDMRWLPYPKPKEGVGVSNNRFGFGHPDFSEARFALDSREKLISIQMRY